MSEVAVVAGRCVIWRCQNLTDKLACDEHLEGLLLPKPPCRHGNVGRCRLCWESAVPEDRNARARAQWARNKQDPKWVAAKRKRQHEAYVRRRDRQLATKEGA